VTVETEDSDSRSRSSSFSKSNTSTSTRETNTQTQTNELKQSLSDLAMGLSDDVERDVVVKQPTIPVYV